MPSETPQEYFPILFGLSLLWVSGWVVASVLYRRSRGKPIMFRGVPDALFVESAASGHSNRSWFTKLGGASRCLVVAVTGNRLITVTGRSIHRDDEFRVRGKRALEKTIVGSVPNDTELGQRITHQEALDNFSDELWMIPRTSAYSSRMAGLTQASIRPAGASS
jgi:hypothetical protein